MPRFGVTAQTAVVVLGVVLLAGGCSGDPSSAPTPSADVSSPSSRSAPVSSSLPEVPRPDGPEADLSQRLTGGQGVFMGSSAKQELDPGYVEEEYAAVGRATAYQSVGPLAADGVWTFRPTDKARYRTRIVVRRPAAAPTEGVVLVEWLNVSGGLDADPAYQTLREEIVRQGYTWVGVSAQKIGVEGGPSPCAPDIPGAGDVVGKGLKAIDPSATARSSIPATASRSTSSPRSPGPLRAGGPATGGSVPSRGPRPSGESQSAFAPRHLLQRRAAADPRLRRLLRAQPGALGLPSCPGQVRADIVGAILGTPTIFRTDTTCRSSTSRPRPTWRASSARLPRANPTATGSGCGRSPAPRTPTSTSSGRPAEYIDCGVPINDGPMHVVAKAALRHFVSWVTDGTAPPTAAPLGLSSAGVTRDADGIALGGLRTPPVDLPVRVLAGDPGRDDEPLCLLFGTTRPLPERRLAELYDGRADFEQRYGDGADGAIAAGFVLPEDRGALMSYAHPELVRP